MRAQDSASEQEKEREREGGRRREEGVCVRTLVAGGEADDGHVGRAAQPQTGSGANAVGDLESRERESRERERVRWVRPQ